MWHMPVYKYERKDGLSELVASQASVAYQIPLLESSPEEANQSPQHRVLERVTAAKHDFDLFYMKSVLATIGINNNDDVFAPVEVFPSRHTSEDKPLNMQHDTSRVVGHITDSYAVDADYKPIPEDTSIDDLPAKFHILNGDVLYRKWGKPELNAQAEKLIAEILEGKWYVSMECLFRGFDYLVAKGDDQRVIPRNEESAFLTKHLRAYKGTGEYQGYRIHRLMRNITFSGKGLVLKPANPESVILTIASDFSASQADLGYINSTNLIDATVAMEKYEMPENIDIKALTEKVESLTRTVASVERERDEAKQKLTDINIQSSKAEIEGYKTTISKRDAELTDVKAQLATAQSTLTERDKQLENAKAQVTTLEKQINEAKVGSLVIKREAQLVGKGVPTEEAKATVAKFTNLTDEQFDAVAELAIAKHSKSPSVTLPAKQDDTQAIAGATPTPEPALNPSSGVDNKLEATRAELTNWFSDRLNVVDEQETK